MLFDFFVLCNTSRKTLLDYFLLTSSAPPFHPLDEFEMLLGRNVWMKLFIFDAFKAERVESVRKVFFYLMVWFNRNDPLPQLRAKSYNDIIFILTPVPQNVGDEFPNEDLDVKK